MSKYCQMLELAAKIGFNSLQQVMTLLDRPLARNEHMQRDEPAGSSAPAANRVKLNALLPIVVQNLLDRRLFFIR